VIPFNRATYNGEERKNLDLVLSQGYAAGNGPLTKQAESMLSEIHDGSKALLLTSCTHALELSARLLDLQPGDEVIVPSFSFVSTASAFIWNGAKPVFADVRRDTLNIDPESVERLITSKTKAICIVHYAGAGAEPERFARIATEHGIALIEDNAHGLGGSWNGQPLGTFGSISTLSFHETKNVSCGEGGAIILSDASLMERAEILREKGTNRSQYLRGAIDKYQWMDSGSSWVCSEFQAAVLVAQLKRLHAIQAARDRIWETYHLALADWAERNDIQRPSVPAIAHHTSHIYHLRLPSNSERDRFIDHMHQHGVHVVFHYQSLHASPFGRALNRSRNSCPNSDHASQCLVRLPIFEALTDDQLGHICDSILTFGQ